MTEIFSFIGLFALIALAMIGGETLRRALYRALHRTTKAAPPEQETRLADDDPLVDMLHRALANRTGRLRVSDAYLICGIEPGRVNQDQIMCFGHPRAGMGAPAKALRRITARVAAVRLRQGYGCRASSGTNRRVRSSHAKCAYRSR